ncbi:MAG: phosphoribosyltransferase, partial [Chloroflexia bacterium]
PARIVVAVPVAARETCAQLSTEVDEVICPYTPEQFYSVGLWYRDFSPTTDDMVRELLEAANKGE